MFTGELDSIARGSSTVVPGLSTLDRLVSGRLSRPVGWSSSGGEAAGSGATPSEATGPPGPGALDPASGAVCSTGTPGLTVNVPVFAWAAPAGACTGGAPTRDPAVVTLPSETGGPSRSTLVMSTKDCSGMVWSLPGGASARVPPVVVPASETGGPSWFAEAGTDSGSGGGDSSGCSIGSLGLSTAEDSGLVWRALAAGL